MYRLEESFPSSIEPRKTFITDNMLYIYGALPVVLDFLQTRHASWTSTEATNVWYWESGRGGNCGLSKARDATNPRKDN